MNRPEPRVAASNAPWRADDWFDADLAARVAAYVDDPLAVLGADLTGVAAALGTCSWSYVSSLATLGAVDLSVARVAEPHVDALAILEQAGRPDLARVGVDESSTFGVYAAQAPGARLVAAPPATSTGAVTLSGRKPWCSLAGSLTHALVTARSHTAPPLEGSEASRASGPGGLYAIDLRHPGVARESGVWVPRGLRPIETQTLDLVDVPAVPVGGPGWYLGRPGFAWGGIGVAAVWFGGAAALAGSLRAAARRREPDQIASMHLGRADRVLHTCLLALRDAAHEIDAGRATSAAGELLAGRVRAVAAEAAQDVLEVVGHALGPAPLTHDETHARRVADLTVYVRQHHAERDLARLGALALTTSGGF